MHLCFVCEADKGKAGDLNYVNLKGQGCAVELVSKELNHLAAILHVYAGGLNFMK